MIIDEAVIDKESYQAELESPLLICYPYTSSLSQWGRMGYWCPSRSSKPSVRHGLSEVSSILTRSRQALYSKGKWHFSRLIVYAINERETAKERER